MIDAGMMMPVRGRAIRLHMRKLDGNVPKCRYARGAVVIWQEMDNAAVFHTLRTHRMGRRSL